MRQEIEGEVYDTLAGTKLSTYEYKHKGSWEWIYKALFKNENGKFFFHETGGCGTHYAVQIGNKLIGGIFIIYPATPEQAKMFLVETNPELAQQLFFP